MFDELNDDSDEMNEDEGNCQLKVSNCQFTYNSDTEQSDEELLVNIKQKNNEKYYIGKDESTIWHKQTSKDSPTIKVLCNETFGIKQSLNQITTPSEIFNCFITNEMLNIICDFTNKYIQKSQTFYSRERDANPTNIIELKAFIGLLYLGGLMKNSYSSVSELWAKDGTGIEIVPAIMSERRFKFLFRAIKFEDEDISESGIHNDALLPIKIIFTKFVDNCKENYIVGNCAVDCLFERTTSRLPFVKKIKNKSFMQIFALIDIENNYVSNLEINTDDKELNYDGKEIVKRLIQPIAGSGRGIICNNWFSSVSLANDLLKNHYLTFVGVLKKTSNEIPPEFLNRKMIGSHTYGYNDDITLVSYTPKKNRVILGISTLFLIKKTEDKKPEMLSYYYKCKSGIYKMKETLLKHSVYQSNKYNWPLAVFYSILNITCLNSHILLRCNTHEKISRTTFLKRLSLDLFQEQLKIRATCETLPANITIKIRQFAKDVQSYEQFKKGHEIFDQEVDAPPEKRKSRLRCRDCPRQLDRKTVTVCYVCSKSICKQHCTQICSNCSLLLHK